jgi:hypothetical protein
MPIMSQAVEEIFFESMLHTQRKKVILRIIDQRTMRVVGQLRYDRIRISEFSRTPSCGVLLVSTLE